MDNVTVIKATGEKEPFSEEKLRKSIRRAHVPEQLHDEAVAHIKSILRPDIPSSEIYKHILEYLARSPYPHTKGRYSLKQSIMDLGPTGFPFEKYVASILHHYGYTVETDVIMNGLCISHEVDVFAQKEDQKIMIECKFHNQVGSRTDVKVALYVLARFQDLTAGWMNKNNPSKINQVWLVTNTKATVDARSYAQCMGMKIISWGYPEKGNLQDLIEEKKLHPVTSLSNLSNYHKQLLLQNNIVLCQDLLNNKSFIELLNLTHDQKNLLLSELQSLSGL